MQNAANIEVGSELPRVVANVLVDRLQRRKDDLMDPSVDLERRVFWRAYQRGSLTEDELARSLDHLDFGAKQ